MARLRALAGGRVILVDRALREREREGRPIRVGLVGAGFMGRAIALQIERYTPGMRVAAIANRRLRPAVDAYALAGADPVTVDSASALARAIERGRPAVTDDALLVCEADGVDVVYEVTGAVEHGAHVACAAIEHGKHLVQMNAELDGTIGPLLKARADAAGVVYTLSDGDQPGVIMNLYRFVRGIGVRPVLCGNVKGLHDPYRNPATQREFARTWGQKPEMVTSFADGTKISFEQAVVANGTGMRVARRGMLGPSVEPGTQVADAVADGLYPLDELLEGPGIVDYVVGALPAPGVFVLGVVDDETQQHYLRLYKLGDGPLYCFTTPYHLCHFEAPATIARAALFGDTTLAPLGPPCVEVVAAAKIDLAAGTTIDALGGYTVYGLAENAGTARAERLLPIGLAPGCRLTRAVSRDDVLTFDDVAVPPGRLSDRLWHEQNELFGLDSPRALAAVAEA